MWERGSVAATITSESSLAKRIQFQVAGQDPVELDSNQMPGYASDSNHPVLQALGAPTAWHEARGVRSGHNS